jgi:hypothetical protein
MDCPVIFAINFAFILGAISRFWMSFKSHSPLIFISLNLLNRFKDVSL